MCIVSPEDYAQKHLFYFVARAELDCAQVLGEACKIINPVQIWIGAGSW